MNMLFFDGSAWYNLLPLTYTRPCAEIRCGILTIKEKWEKRLPGTYSYLTRKYLSNKFPTHKEEDNFLINGSVIPTPAVVEAVQQLKDGQCLVKGEIVIAARVQREKVYDTYKLLARINSTEGLESIECDLEFEQISKAWNIFELNGKEIQSDLNLMNLKSNAESVSARNTVFGDDLFIEEGAKVQGCILNTETGPIHLGKNAEVMEGSVIRGPFSLGESATVKMASKIYGPTTIGPYSKVGGEVTNVVMFAYSNKGHDGFIGNSVIGEWCNFGADTNSSNLKNNYSPVRVWSYHSESMEETDLQFCGLIAGDHCKTGINTMLNTGTVLGVSSNVFGSSFPNKFIPSFTWGGTHKSTTFKLDKAYEVADSMMKRRGIDLSEDDKNILEHIFLSDSTYRK